MHTDLITYAENRRNPYKITSKYRNRHFYLKAHAYALKDNLL